MDKKQLVKLAVAALTVGLSTESIQAADLNQAVDSTVLAATCSGKTGGCQAKSGCRARSGCQATADNSCSAKAKTADNACAAHRNENTPPQPNTVRDDFRSHLKTTQSLYDTLSPEERRMAREAINQNSSKSPDDAVREVYEKKTGSKAPKA